MTPFCIRARDPFLHPGALRFTIPGFGEDSDGELYVFSNATSQLIGKSGKVWKIVAGGK